jgi:integrase
MAGLYRNAPLALNVRAKRVEHRLTQTALANRCGLSAENPLARVRLPKADEQPPKAWRQDEVDRLLTEVAGGIHEAWLIFSLGTGVRLGEARALLWSDVDLVARTAVIRRSADNRDGRIGPTKTRKVRTIDLADEVIPYLAEHRKRQAPGELLVFGHNGRPYDSNAPRRWLGLRCKAAGIRVLPPHATRHTFCSLALEAGVPVQDIAKQLGHTVQTMLRTYAWYIGDNQRRAVNAVGVALTRTARAADRSESFARTPR